MEIWKPIPGALGYEVSSEGEIRQQHTTIGLNTYLSRCGYKLVYVPGLRNVKSVHRLVAEAFLGPSNLDVHHKNKRKADNRVSNLEYTSHYHRGDQPRGRKAALPNAKLNEHSVGVIKWLLKNATVVRRTDIAEAFGVTYQTIYRIAQGKRWAWIK